MLWAQQILICLAKLKEMIAIILQFMLHFKMEGGALCRCSPRAPKSPTTPLTYSIEPSSSWEASRFSLVRKLKEVVYSVLTQHQYVINNT